MCLLIPVNIFSQSTKHPLTTKLSRTENIIPVIIGGVQLEKKKKITL